MTTPTYAGEGSLFALGMKLTRLAENGAPLVGDDNSYVTNALVQANLGLEYEEGNEIIQRNGAGEICLTYKAPDSLKRGTISSLQVCTPDPAVLEFLQGGRVLYDDTMTPVGYQAPEVGSDPTPNGVGIEFFSRAIMDGAYAGYFWWVLPRAFLRTSGEWSLSGSDPLLPEFEGQMTQNPQWGDGPSNLWHYPSDRVWQYVQTDTLPYELEPPRFVDVAAELSTSSVAVSPTSATVAVGETVQITAEATMSDGSTRNVTQTATWTSADETMATVDDKGLVTGVATTGASTVDVTATYGGASASAAITVS